MLGKIVAAVLLMQFPLHVLGYSVLTHEAIVDATWKSTIVPLLLTKYPGSTDSQLNEAHAYTYGGCLTSDMGYYPYGSKMFTNLVHYVRTGDLISNMLDSAHDINEYAFALGMLCHYNADKYGHDIGVNRSVPLIFTKDKDKYGTYVTYEQDPVAHVRTEFGFDVLQTARGNYASKEYHDLIGFKIAVPLLERTFLATYGIHIGDLFKNFSTSVETFRWTIKNFFPTITKAAWASRKAQIRKTRPTATRHNFEYKMRNANYYAEYGKKHERPGFFPSVIAAIVRVLPKVGSLKDLKITIPNAESEKLFISSFDSAQAHCTASMAQLKKGKPRLADIDYDTGIDTYPGEYDLADKTYMELLLKLKENHFKYTDNRLKQNILDYYNSCNTRMAAIAGIDTWKEVTAALDSLKLYQPN